ncbi:DMT family transporter [Bacillus tianshenii]|nr:DMT family transporter [Bacillus tianshenii]
MLKAYILLLLAITFFSGNFIVGKSVADTIPPFTLALCRASLALFFVSLFGFRQWKRHLLLWKKEWKPLAGMALTGIVGFTALVYLSLHYTTTINASIVEASTPIVVALFSIIFLKEKLQRHQYVGIILSFIGVLWVVTEGSIQRLLSLSLNTGDFIMVLAVFSWAIYSLLVKEHSWKFPLYGSLLSMLFIAVLVLFPLALTEAQQWSSINWSTPVLLQLLYLGIFPSVLALTSWNKAVEIIGPSKASTFLNLIPVFTSIGAVLLLNETFLFVQLYGGLLVIIGVFITTRR